MYSSSSVASRLERPLPGRKRKAHIFTQGLPRRPASIIGKMRLITAAGAGHHVHPGLLQQWPVLHAGIDVRYGLSSPSSDRSILMVANRHNGRKLLVHVTQVSTSHASIAMAKLSLTASLRRSHLRTSTGDGEVYQQHPPTGDYPTMKASRVLAFGLIVCGPHLMALRACPLMPLIFRSFFHAVLPFQTKTLAPRTLHRCTCKQNTCPLRGCSAAAP